jgi:hypothetical protein
LPMRVADACCCWSLPVLIVNAGCRVFVATILLRLELCCVSFEIIPAGTIRVRTIPAGRFMWLPTGSNFPTRNGVL